MSETVLRTELFSLFQSQQLAVLSTFGGGQPYSSLVAFAGTEDLRDVLFATGRNTRKFANLQAEPRAALLVDNRSNSAADFHGACAVTATGRAREVLYPERTSLLQVYLEKHPYLEDFIRTPDCALLRVAVDHYYRVRHFQEVDVLHLEPCAS